MASIKEQRAKLQDKIAALQAREQALANKEAEQERKARTKRLIELGAIIESKLTEETIYVIKHIDRDKCLEIEHWAKKHMEEANKNYFAEQRKLDEEREKRKAKKKPSKDDGDEKEN